MNILDFKKKKKLKEKISMLTCYDYPSAYILAESSIDCVLVGDSVAMAVHGYESTIMASMNMMVMHTQAVARGLKSYSLKTQRHNLPLLISDMPFLSYRTSKATTMKNVKDLVQAGAQVLKIEGADKNTCQIISYIVASGIPVIGHIGLTPQLIHQLGGYKVQGKNSIQVDSLLRDAESLESAGCSALVIECVPQNVAETITKHLSIPTIGIGAGVMTDGQVLVWHDMLGLQNYFTPKFLKQYAQSRETILYAINAYINEVKTECFPALEHSF